MNSKIPALLEIVRPFNVAIMMLVIAAAVILAGGTPDDWERILLASLVGGLIGGGANAINDYFDIDIDRINKPRRPLPRGAVTPHAAVRLWLILSLVGISLNLFLPSDALWIAIAAVVVLFLYSARWKRKPLVGNVAVAVMTGMAFIYGATVAGAPERAAVPALFAFLINLAREIIKDVEDMEGDRKGNALTFPLRFGATRALSLASVVLVLLIATTVAAYAGNLYDADYLRVIAVVDALIVAVLVSLWLKRTPAHLSRLSLILKVTMVIGLVALYVGS